MSAVEGIAVSVIFFGGILTIILFVYITFHVQIFHEDSGIYTLSQKLFASLLCFMVLL